MEETKQKRAGESAFTIHHRVHLYSTRVSKTYTIIKKEEVEHTTNTHLLIPA